MFGILALVQAIAYQQTHIKWLMWIALALCIKAIFTPSQKVMNGVGVIAALIVIFLL